MKSSNKLLIAMLVFLCAFYSRPVSCTDKPFGVSLILSSGLIIQYYQGLVFPDTAIGSNVNVTVLTTDAGAARFDAAGKKNKQITKSVVESSINLAAPGVAGTILVDTFTVAGPTSFDNNGHAYGFRVGATAHVLSTSLDGDYAGTATFRVVSN